MARYSTIFWQKKNWVSISLVYVSVAYWPWSTFVGTSEPWRRRRRCERDRDRSERHSDRSRFSLLKRLNFCKNFIPETVIYRPLEDRLRLVKFSDEKSLFIESLSLFTSSSRESVRLLWRNYFLTKDIHKLISLLFAFFFGSDTHLLSSNNFDLSCTISFSFLNY